MKKMLIDNKWVKLQIWDTAGQERFRTITNAYYRGAMGILLVYDVTDESSFNNIRNWISNIQQNASESVNKILIGNKCDMDESKRVVSFARGKALADEFGLSFFETSAKNNVQVDDSFTTLAREVKDRLVKESAREAAPAARASDAEVNGGGAVKLDSSKKKFKKKCCDT
mmetsp:Transcript_420/g.1153  ORF Transcript_420/g.1153 Transcript_420/m.1153 type:complete len:170 (+) Transcript_420:761-1270(+)